MQSGVTWSGSSSNTFLEGSISAVRATSDGGFIITLEHESQTYEAKYTDSQIDNAYSSFGRDLSFSSQSVDITYTMPDGSHPYAMEGLKSVTSEVESYTPDLNAAIGSGIYFDGSFTHDQGGIQTQAGQPITVAFTINPDKGPPNPTGNGLIDFLVGDGFYIGLKYNADGSAYQLLVSGPEGGRSMVTGPSFNAETEQTFAIGISPTGSGSIYYQGGSISGAGNLESWEMPNSYIKVDPDFRGFISKLADGQSVSSDKLNALVQDPSDYSVISPRVVYDFTSIDSQVETTSSGGSPFGFGGATLSTQQYAEHPSFDGLATGYDLSSDGSSIISVLHSDWSTESPLTLSQAGWYTEPDDFVLGRDGSVYVVGRTYPVGQYNDDGIRIWKINSDGSIDSKTGTTGFVVDRDQSGLMSTSDPVVSLDFFGNLTIATSHDGEISILELPASIFDQGPSGSGLYFDGSGPFATGLESLNETRDGFAMEIAPVALMNNERVNIVDLDGLNVYLRHAQNVIVRDGDMVPTYRIEVETPSGSLITDYIFQSNQLSAIQISYDSVMGKVQVKGGPTINRVDFDGTWIEGNIQQWSSDIGSWNPASWVNGSNHFGNDYQGFISHIGPVGYALLDDAVFQRGTLSDIASVVDLTALDNQSSINSRKPVEIVSVVTTNEAFAVITGSGDLLAWGEHQQNVPTQLTSDVVEVVGTMKAFAARLDDGSIISWGSDLYGGTGGVIDGGGASVSVDLTTPNFTQIAATDSAFAALTDSGGIVTWGRDIRGGDSSSVDLSSGFSKIYSNLGAFAGVRSDGSVVTWGLANQGGDSSSVATSLQSGVENIFSTVNAFAALKSDGSVVTWGDQNQGGNSATVDLSSSVVSVVATNTAFAALKNDGSVTTWGSQYGGDSSTVSSQIGTGVTEIHSNGTSFAALKSDGSVVTWGYSAYGGDSSAVDLSSDVVEIYATDTAYAALKSDGSVVTWGQNDWGGDSSSVNLTNVVDIVASYGAFAAIKSDGSVVTWGSNSHGGDSSAVQASLAGGVSKGDIFANDYAFVLIKNDGEVVSWGHPSRGGDSSGVTFEVISEEISFNESVTAIEYTEVFGVTSVVQADPASNSINVATNKGTSQLIAIEYVQFDDGTYVVNADGSLSLRNLTDAELASNQIIRMDEPYRLMDVNLGNAPDWFAPQGVEVNYSDASVTVTDLSTPLASNSLWAVGADSQNSLPAVPSYVDVIQYRGVDGDDNVRFGDYIAQISWSAGDDVYTVDNTTSGEANFYGVHYHEHLIQSGEAVTDKGLVFDMRGGNLVVTSDYGVTTVSHIDKLLDTKGSDVVHGSSGSDQFRFNAGGIDTVTAGTGNDKFRIEYRDDPFFMSIDGSGVGYGYGYTA
ncbi:hypothetical protein OAQ35_06850, partial [Litorivicinus sp.]|nr:hypothetical protein [Litorivicinus sp.]